MKSYLKGHHFNIGATGGRQIINSSVSQDVAASAVQGSNQEKYSDQVAFSKMLQNDFKKDQRSSHFKVGFE